MILKPIAVRINEAASLSGCGRTMIYEAISSGELPSALLGRRRVVRVVDLETWVSARVERRGCGSDVR